MQQRCLMGVSERAASSRSASSSVARPLGAPSSAPLRRQQVAAGAFRRAQPDEPKDGQMVAQGKEWIETILSRFGPIREKAASLSTLDFEKPLLELDKRIKEVRGARRASAAATDSPEAVAWAGRQVRGGAFPRVGGLSLGPRGDERAQVRKVAEENGVDVTPQIAELEQRARQVRAAAWGPRFRPLLLLEVAGVSRCAEHQRQHAPLSACLLLLVLCSCARRRTVA